MGLLRGGFEFKDTWPARQLKLGPVHAVVDQTQDALVLAACLSQAPVYCAIEILVIYVLQVFELSRHLGLMRFLTCSSGAWGTNSSGRAEVGRMRWHLAVFVCNGAGRKILGWSSNANHKSLTNVGTRRNHFPPRKTSIDPDCRIFLFKLKQVLQTACCVRSRKLRQTFQHRQTRRKLVIEPGMLHDVMHLLYSWISGAGQEPHKSEKMTLQNRVRPRPPGNQVSEPCTPLREIKRSTAFRG